MWQPEIVEYRDGNIFDTIHADLHRGLSDDKTQFNRRKETFFFDDDLVNEFLWEATDAAVTCGALRSGVESCSIEIRCSRGEESKIIGEAGRYGNIPTSYVRVCFARENGDKYRISSVYPVAEYQVNTDRLKEIDLNTIDAYENRWTPQKENGVITH